MNKPWLLFDCNFLCHRASHSGVGKLSYNGVPTGTIYGFLKDVSYLMKQFDTDRTVFAWDFGRGKRKEVSSAYKEKREQEKQEYTGEQEREYAAFQKQVWKLRGSFLRRLGFKNVFFEQGYEADDIIASVANNIDSKDSAIIISADQDLWQLLRDGVTCYNPISKKTLDHITFMNEWGIEPPLWANVKAFAGCGTDEVVGIHGIGEKTAAMFYCGKLKEESAKYQKIVNNLDVLTKNIPLVRLPFEGTPEYTLVEDNGPSFDPWMGMCKALGMEALKDMFPGRYPALKQRRSFGL